MRTTLDIDDDVLQAAKELAAAERKTAGEVLSRLARRGLTTPMEPEGPVQPNGLILKNGFYVLPNREGLIVTTELVNRLLEEADLEDAGLKDE